MGAAKPPPLGEHRRPDRGWVNHPSVREATAGLSIAVTEVAPHAGENSYPSMPITIAPTNTTIGRLRPARLTSAGPGQIPTRPQPTPNKTPPATSGTSMSRRVGHR